jgi:hypothetical protein
MMNRRRSPILLAALAGIGVVLALGVLVVTQPRTSSSKLFPDELAGMPLAVYVDGAAAIAEVQALHRDNPSVKMVNAYLVRYSGTGTARARFWVSEATSDTEAASLVAAMRSTVGNSGVFSQPVPLTLEGLAAYSVKGPPEIGTYNYFYAKGRLVVWVQIDGPDEARRMGILGESVRRIGP